MASGSSSTGNSASNDDEKVNMRLLLTTAEAKIKHDRRRFTQVATKVDKRTADDDKGAAEGDQVGVEDDHKTAEDGFEKVNMMQLSTTAERKLKKHDRRRPYTQIVTKDDKGAAGGGQAAAGGGQAADKGAAEDDQAAAEDDKGAAEHDQVAAEDDKGATEDDQVAAEEDKGAAEHDQVASEDYKGAAKDSQVIAKVDNNIMLPENDNLVDNLAAKDGCVMPKLGFDEITAMFDGLLAEFDDVHEAAEADDDMIGYPSIGHLRMFFYGDKNSKSDENIERETAGTAFLIANGACLLTCAHNVVYEGEQSNKGIFELSGHKYEVNKTEVYLRYWDYPDEDDSGFDLALCWIIVPENDNHIKELYSNYGDYMPNPLAGEFSITKVAVVGFPDEHEGEKWGMSRKVPIHLRNKWKFSAELNKRELLEYDFIDTSKGQSGSPIMGLEPIFCVIGVHTGGSSEKKKNWGSCITPEKLEWIRDSLGEPWKIYYEYGTLRLAFCCSCCQ